MHDLGAILNTLDSDDVAKLELRLISRRKKLSRKDVELIRLLSAQPSVTSRELIPMIYGSVTIKSRNAYHALRKRVANELIDYVVNRMQNESASREVEIAQTHEFARYLFENRLDVLGWKYLRKAEKLAVQGEAYHFLTTIYSSQIEHAHLEGAPPLSNIRELKLVNHSNVERADRMRMALAFLRIRIKQIRIEASAIEPEKLLNQVIRDYELEGIVNKHPDWLFIFTQLVRNAFVAKKNFLVLESFLLENMSRFDSYERELAPFGMAQLWYFLAHAQYRNKRFGAAASSLENALSYMPKLLKRQQSQLHARLTLLQAAVLCFQGNNSRSIVLLEHARNHSAFQKSTDDRANLYFNLVVYYFQENQFEKAYSYLRFFPNSASWCTTNMGVEWMLKKSLVEMIVLVELEDYKLARRKINAITKKYDGLFNQDKYSRIPVFLDYVKRWIDDPVTMQNQKTYDKVRSDLVTSEALYEDLQAMGYFAWLKSKLLNLEYYPVLLGMVS